jgi:DNA-binding CsgD family transcriptional regulator/tetratricopeptide (TPR) repeat protein
VAAARAASSLYAHGVAVARWEQALAKVDAMDAATRRTLLDAVGLHHADLLMRTAQVAALTGAHDRGLALAEKALLQADADPEIARSGVLRSDYGRILWGAGRFEKAHEVFREAAELVTATGTIADRARVMGRYALILMWRSEVHEGVVVAREAVESARQAGLRAVEAEALDSLGNALRTLGSIGEAIQRFWEAHAAAVQSGGIEEQLFVSDSLAECLVDSDQLDDAIGVANLAEEDARTFGLDRTFGAMFRGNAGHALFALGRWAEADAITDHGMEIGHGRVWGMCGRARLLAAMGRSADARAAIAAVTAMFPEGLPDLAKLEMALPAAELQLLDGEADRSLDTVLSALDIEFPFAYLRLRLDLAAAGLRAAADIAQDSRGRRDAQALARANAAGARCLAEIGSQRAILIGWDTAVVSKLATADLAEAELSRLQGRSEPERWAAVASAFASVPMPYPAAYARYRQAEALLVLGGVKAAVGDLLRDANETCRRLGARPLGTAIERLARQARVDLTPRAAAVAAEESATAPGRETRTRPSNELNLSERELQVLSLVAAGRTNGQIAAELYISPKTASVHVTHILDKLGAANRAEAAMIAERAGLLAPELRAAEA